MPRQPSPSLQAFRKSRAYRAGVLLKQLHLGLTATVEARLQDEGLDLTRPQAVALMVLIEHPGASNAELARLNGVSPQTMHQTLLRLERDGLVSRAPHPRLKRVQALEATPEGVALVTRGSAVARTAIEAVLGGLRTTQQDELVGLLERCAAALPAAAATALNCSGSTAKPRSGGLRSGA
ncbi:MarR family transcriptional regulator [Luteimonas sp. MC1825]|uniref:MarR family winged helix-turn-helix transcriptional regulator n=1 Tax=Luteimonas sp. MC1825 TaxID=2761107 RepID=UPI00161FDCC6|nr:MarR family transcriptional regulator [Luteimonas sp. MC1825]MBB6598787.1 MarR family transcriptional regulator [Luteimonas sp. MC1825]QOC88944.1 MarR family transcriptional regulator [Luteimonas sp. MC1825]